MPQLQPPIPLEKSNISHATSPGPGLFPASDLVNSLSNPTGPEYRFRTSEGTYTLKDDILLGLVPQHPGAPPTQPVNVLDPKPFPPVAGVKLSLAILAPHARPSRFRDFRKSGSIKSFIPPSIAENNAESSQSAHSGSDKGITTPHSAQSPSSRLGFGSFRVRFGDAITQSPSKSKEAKEAKALLKRSKPKQGLGKSGSTFVSRVVHDEHLSKRLQERSPDGIFAFANINRAFLWLDLSSPKKKDNLSKILFTKSHPICHDFNTVTKTQSHLDVAIGFASGDIIWYEAISQKYTRINKNNMINESPVSEIRWVPKSATMFVAAHFDGNIVIYDKEKEDAPFEPEDNFRLPDRFTRRGQKIPRLSIRKSIHSPNQKSNPVGYWKVTSRKIRGMEFSPDGRLLAIVSEDGTLRIIDYEKEELLDVMPSYFGGMTCVCWSADGMYILTGSQDDLVSVWSLADRSLVARCTGHHSWLTGVAFDPWHCDDKTYRFGSVGEDGRLLLWDFSVGLLNKPRAASVRQSISSYAAPHGQERTGSVATVKPILRDVDTPPPISENEAAAGGEDVSSVLESATDALNAEQQKQQQQELTLDTSLATQGSGQVVEVVKDEDEVYHPVLPRSHVAMLPPILSKKVDPHPLTWLAFEEDCIITSCRRGHIRIWDRPKNEDGDAQSSSGVGQAGQGQFRFTDPFSGSGGGSSSSRATTTE